MPQIDSLMKRRSNIKGSLTKISNYITTQREIEASKLDIEHLKVRSRRIETLLTEFQETEEAISSLTPDDESQLDEFEEKYYTAVAELNKLIRKANLAFGNVSVDLNETQGEHVRTANIEVKLPRINIPPFYGSYAEWQSFYDLFSSTIHENPNLHPAQKFQYLRSYLRDEAANLLKHLPISDANYIEALNKLKSRYDRKRYTIQSFIKGFVEMPSIKNSPTSQQIRKLMDNADEVIRGLKALGPEADSRDPWLVFLLVQKLDEDTKDRWASETAEIEFPTCQTLIGFLMKRADALDSAKSYPGKSVHQVIAPHKTLTNTIASCAVCQNDYHPLFMCPKFNEWTVDQRREFMKTDNRCFNCFSKSHTVYYCRSKGRCYICKRSHNSLLHPIFNANCSSSEGPDCSSTPEKSTTLLTRAPTTATDVQPQYSSCMHSSHHSFMLPTATVRVQDRSGQYQLCRFLLDSGSQTSLITESFVQKLGLERKHGNICIQGLANQNLLTTRDIVDISISPHFTSNFKTDISAYVVPFITMVKPIEREKLINYHSISTLSLADKGLTFASKIDLLIGPDTFFHILKPQQLKDSEGKIYGHNTHFGWILTGNLISMEDSGQCNIIVTNIDLERNLKRFWECEEVFSNAPPLPEDQICEELFETTTTKLQDNHLMVKLPFKTEQKPLKESLGMAVKRLCAMERKFAKNPELHKHYVEFMEEYIKLGHMIEVEPPKQPTDYLYLPHHAVWRETSTTTRLRVVFDASAKTTSGYSLNDNLLTGPVLQNLIGDILLRFRVHQIVFTADAEKMFRQIWIHPEDRRYQRIVWRTKPDDDIHHFELKTLTYGMPSAPYLATRVIKQIAKDNAGLYPEASEILLKDMYIDDLLTGAPEMSKAVELAK